MYLGELLPMTSHEHGSKCIERDNLHFLKTAQRGTKRQALTADKDRALGCKCHTS